MHERLTKSSRVYCEGNHQRSLANGANALANASSSPPRCEGPSSLDWTMRKSATAMDSALERWIALARIQPGEPLFRSIKKGGHVRGRLKDGRVSLALKARVVRYLRASCHTRDAAVAEAFKFSGPSGRVGLYTAASEAGIAIEAVAALARHKSLNV